MLWFQNIYIKTSTYFKISLCKHSVCKYVASQSCSERSSIQSTIALMLYHISEQTTDCHCPAPCIALYPDPFCDLLHHLSEQTLLLPRPCTALWPDLFSNPLYHIRPDPAPCPAPALPLPQFVLRSAILLHNKFHPAPIPPLPRPLPNPFYNSLYHISAQTPPLPW